MDLRRIVLVVLACSLLAAPACATTWDAVAGFIANPNGPFTYNWYAPMTIMGTFGAYQGDTNIEGWTPDAETAFPYILKTTTGAEYVSGGVHFLPDELVLRTDGNWPVVRFTVPEDGFYTWSFQFTNRQEGSTASYPAAGGLPEAAMWSGVLAYGESGGVVQDVPVWLAAGGNFDMFMAYDAVGLKAQFTLVPEPSALLAMCTGLFGVIGIAARRGRS